MDQRNAGESRTDIKADHGWHTYAADHMALMDHLGFEKFHVLGGCIGGSFCLKAVETAPHRVTSAVLQNPIGLHPEHPEYFPDSHAEWTREQLAARPDLNAEALAAFGRNMWDHPFVFCVDRDIRPKLSGADVPAARDGHPASGRDQRGARGAVAGRGGADRLARAGLPAATGDPGGGIPRTAHAVDGTLKEVLDSGLLGVIRPSGHAWTPRRLATERNTPREAGR